MHQSQETIVTSGVVIPNDASVLSPVILDAISRGYYEAEEARNLPAIIQEGEVVLELGTGLGVISTMCARDKRVRSVKTLEGNPRLLPYIKRVLELNGVGDRIETLNAIALPNPTIETTKFYLREDFWASSLDCGPWGFSEVVDVPVIDLNAMISNIRPTLLIVDIEGGERTLFDDIVLTGVRKIFIELHQSVLGRHGMKALFDRMSALNYHYDQWHSERSVVLFSHIDRH